MSLIIYVLVFLAGYVIGKNKRGNKEYSLYKKNNGLFEPVKRS